MAKKQEKQEKTQKIIESTTTNSNNKKWDTKINIIDLIQVVILLLGGIFGYFFIQKPLVAESITKRELAELEFKISTNYKEILTKLDISEKEIKINQNISDFILDIQPNLEVSLNQKIEYFDDEFNLVFEISNKGKHPFTIDDIDFYLSKNIITNPIQTDNYLKKGTDYTYKMSKIGLLAPNTKGNHAIIIKVSKKYNLSEIKQLYFYTMFHTSTYDIMQKVAKKFLASYLSDDDINSLLSKSVGRYGPLNFK